MTDRAAVAQSVEHLVSTQGVAGSNPARRSRGRPITKNWKKVASDMALIPPSVILPLTDNPRSLHHAAALFGIRILWRKRPDGWHVWRVE